MDPDACEMAWRKWSTYQTAENALDRRDKLASKGHTSRVIDSTTGKVLPDGKRQPTCPMCGDAHEGPFDGSCLL
jgi:hypothetical protein